MNTSCLTGAGETKTCLPICNAMDMSAIIRRRVPGTVPGIGLVNFGHTCSAAQLTMAKCTAKGHARFGRTYEFGVLEDLGMTNAHKKFNIIGHSFGGPVVKEVCNLFIQGSEAERNGTDPDDLSPLFLGGHGDLIHCAATLSGVNNGTTLASSQKRLIKPVMGGLMMLNVALRDTPIMKYYNFHTQQWGLMEWPDQNDTWKFHSPFSRMAGVLAI